MKQVVLSSRIDVAGEMEFTSDGAVQEVSMLPPGIGNVIDFHDANGLARFESGDNILLKKIWLNIPHGFRQGTGTARFQLLWKNALGTTASIDGFPINSAINFPDVCGGLEFPGNGLFIKTPTNLGDVGLIISDNGFTQLNISQANLPAILDATTFKVQMHLLILHTKATV